MSHLSMGQYSIGSLDVHVHDVLDKDLPGSSFSLTNSPKRCTQRSKRSKVPLIPPADSTVKCSRF